MSIRFVMCADDYALRSSMDRTILDLIEQQRISATTSLVNTSLGTAETALKDGDKIAVGKSAQIIPSGPKVTTAKKGGLKNEPVKVLTPCRTIEGAHNISPMRRSCTFETAPGAVFYT